MATRDFPPEVHVVDSLWFCSRARLRALLFVVALAALAPAGASVTAGAAEDPGQQRVAATAAHAFADPGPRLTAERVPLIEIFTATWCVVCAEADRALERILQEDREGPAPALVAYHPWPDQEDPFGFPEGHQRMVYQYRALGFPTVWVDGTWEDAGAYSSISEEPSTVDEGLEDSYYRKINTMMERSVAGPPDYELTTNWSVEQRNVDVRLELQSLTTDDRPTVVRGFVWEDHMQFLGSNGIEDHRMTARAALGAQQLPPMSENENWSTSWQVDLPADMDMANAGFTVWVERPESDENAVDANHLMGLAIGVGLTGGVVAFALVSVGRQPTRRKNEDDRDET